MSAKVGVNEFSRILTNGPPQLKAFVNDYPVIALVSAFVLSFFGISNVFSFSIVSIASGVIFAGTAYGIWHSIFSDFETFWKNLKKSLLEVFCTESMNDMQNKTSSKAIKDVLSTPSTPLKAVQK